MKYQLKICQHVISQTIIQYSILPHNQMLSMGTFDIASDNDEGEA